MRKHMLAAAALGAVTGFLAGPAAAQKEKMKPYISVNGYYEGVVGDLLGDTRTALTWTAPALPDGDLALAVRPDGGRGQPPGAT